MRKMIYLRSQLPLSNNNVEENGEFPSLEHFYNLFHLMMNFDKSINLISDGTTVG